MLMTQAHTSGPVVEARDVIREFRVGRGTIRALRGVSLMVAPGEMVALRGRSGAGKTTLLNVLTGLDDPTGGSVTLLGHELARLDEAARARLRRNGVGILFQQSHLFPLLTAQENVELMLRLSETPGEERRARALRALDLVGLVPRAHHRALELSGGEQQRVALARALVHGPRFLVADEPTGSLDTRTGRDITALLRDIAHEQDVVLLVATHDATVAGAADRVLDLHDGMIAAR